MTIKLEGHVAFVEISHLEVFCKKNVFKNFVFFKKDRLQPITFLKRAPEASAFLKVLRNCSEYFFLKRF